MYYGVAIQTGQSSSWQWKSMVLSSLQDLFEVLQIYRAVGEKLDHLRVFSSSREKLNGQLERENKGLQSSSVTAPQFLQESMLAPRGAERTPSSAAVTEPELRQNSGRGNTLDARGLSSLESRRLELESGAGADHDIPYRFALPASMAQVLPWMRLLGKIHRGERPP